MASNDRVFILTDDETDERWRRVHGKSVNSDSLEQGTGPSAPAPAPEAPGTDPQTSASPLQLRMGCMDRICLAINRHLLISKIFYFFFYSAYGSLHPLLPVYYKQLGLTATQSGLLVGIRYFIEFCSAPFWGVIADRFRKGKAVLLFSVLCWLVFNCGIGFVKPADITCVEQGSAGDPQNLTQLNTSVSYSRPLRNADADFFAAAAQFHDDVGGYKLLGSYARSARASSTETPSTLDNASSPASSTASSTPAPSSATATPSQYKIQYNMMQVETIFLLILLVIVFGEFFSAPAVTIVDTVTLQYLGQQRDRYGLQRMWGSLGWGLAMLSVGIWIDHTHIQPYILGGNCGDTDFKDYRIAFIVFGVLMGVALVVATQFNVDHRFGQTETREEVRSPQREGNSTSNRSSESSLPPGTRQQEFHFGDLISILCSVQCSAVLFVAWFMGFGYGFVFSFLYWYLQTLKGTTTLFGICSVLSHVSELVAYFTSHKLIELVGHIRVLYIGLACNTARYLYISYLQNAWIVLPMEVLQGLTHASVWAACISYLAATVPPALRTSAQGLLQGLHLGLGRGCGAMLGGVFISYFGEAATFRGLGMASLVILIIIFTIIQCFAGQSESEENSMLADSVSAPSFPVPIATIDATPQQPPMKTRHQQEQEDPNKSAWVLSASPWVSMAFTLCQIREAIKRAKRSSLADTRSPQGTDEVASSEPPTEETTHSQPEEQCSTPEQQTSADKQTGQPRKEPTDEMDRNGVPRRPSATSQVGHNPAAENQAPLPGNSDTLPKLSPNNPFYQ